MTNSSGDKFSAGPQALGYMYQPRLALLKLVEQPERTGVLIEGQDDLEFVGEEGNRSLASLKHRAPGNTLTDLSADFWKSVRIWLDRYKSSGRSTSQLQFFMFTTESIADGSFLRTFLPEPPAPIDNIGELFNSAMKKSQSNLISEIEESYSELSEEEQSDFLGRVSIFDQSPRITNILDLLSDRLLRTVRLEHRQSVLERLEGWWNDIAIRQIAGEKTDPIYGVEVSDKLSSIAEEYQAGNLPITFRGKQPTAINPEADNRMFVRQLQMLGTSSSRIQSAIIDYYRAFEQRSSWARENLVVLDEMGEYEDRLVEEWARYKDLVVESFGGGESEERLIKAGKELHRWAEFETNHLRIRERVTEGYVIRGTFHILANGRPLPRVYWHPKFLDRIESILERVN